MPGQGGLPPHLAGREREQSVLRGHLAMLARGKSPGTGAVLYGPRGNGKTALLLWAVREAREQGVRVVRMPASSEGLGEGLRVELSLLPSWGTGFLRRFRGLKVPGFGIRMNAPEDGALLRMLARTARRRPLLVALDEAHKMDPGPGRDLLNAVQHVQGEGRPVMLALAGTPDLPRHLNAMGASFWERSEPLPIGRLGPEDSADAVRIPLDAAGRSIAPEALEAVVRESHGYPYFLQLWGKEIWDRCPAGTDPISTGDIDRIRPGFRRRQRQFYGNRYRELKRAGLLPAASAVAALFAGGERRVPEEVEGAVGAALAKSGRAAHEAAALEACERLCDLGYIWPVDDGPVPCYEPGIPSLTGYVADAARVGLGRR